MIDVVIPVYGGVQQTRRCIESALACTPAAQADIVVVNDASPEPAIASFVRQLANEGRVTLIDNESNQGFVRSVNRGMALHDDRDVVLLNSDTEVANDWLERLRAAAHRHPDIATVTPFSNNATICSYPFEGWQGGLPGTLGLAPLDRLFARANTALTVDLPTGVGFCMYIRRDALKALGHFDAERFGRGYGEENDFSMRALKSGRRNVLAADVFVFHEGAVSFSDERSQRTAAATEALLQVHPDYMQRVVDFIDADPAQPLRSAVDLARIALGPEEARHVLVERRDEQARWSKRAREAEKYLAQREKHITELHEGLANATAIVAERNQALAAMERTVAGIQADMARLHEEIAKLREGLAYAESLAFGRQKELDEIRAFALWKYYHFLMRHSSRS
ncbi:MAG TPA: glycosyltransferase [Usitatibacter sp.]|nr:glycosyltransferase [Usitatibacter sp.]